MTPAARLRSLVKEATQGHAYALETLRARAPQLAELVADMAPRLEHYDECPYNWGVSPTPCVCELSELLARLAALFPEDSA